MDMGAHGDAAPATAPRAPSTPLPLYPCALPCPQSPTPLHLLWSGPGSTCVRTVGWGQGTRLWEVQIPLTWNL